MKLFEYFSPGLVRAANAGHDGGNVEAGRFLLATRGRHRADSGQVERHARQGECFQVPAGNGLQTHPAGR